MTPILPSPALLLAGENSVSRLRLIASAARRPRASGLGRQRHSFCVGVAIPALERLAIAHVDALDGLTRRLHVTGSRRPHRQSTHVTPALTLLAGTTARTRSP